MFAGAALAATLLFAGGRVERSEPRHGTAAPERTSAREEAPPSPLAAAAAAGGSTPAAAPWPPAEMSDPDPRNRRFALEQWAREPTASLDLVAAAMVDPEESIRERAEQLFEEALARRR